MRTDLADPFLVLQHALANPWLDPLMVALSTACEGWVIALLGVVCIRLLERDPRLAARALIPLGLALLADGLAVQLVKQLWNVPRPLAVLGTDQVRLLVEPLRQRSMPSGHASAAAVLALFLVRRYGWRGVPALALALVGGVARVYVGVHWASDVAVGWAIGATIGVVAQDVAARVEARGVGAVPPLLRRRAVAIPPSGSDPARPGSLPSQAPPQPHRSGSRAEATPPGGASP